MITEAPVFDPPLSPAKAWLKSLEGELEPYANATDIPAHVLWNLITDAAAGVEEHGAAIDVELSKIYLEHGIEVVREGYIEKWLELFLKSLVLRSQGRWWLSLEIKTVKLTAEADDLCAKRFRTAWRLWTVEATAQSNDAPRIGAWGNELFPQLVNVDKEKIEKINEVMF